MGAQLSAQGALGSRAEGP